MKIVLITSNGRKRVKSYEKKSFQVIQRMFRVLKVPLVSLHYQKTLHNTVRDHTPQWSHATSRMFDCKVLATTVLVPYCGKVASLPFSAQLPRPELPLT